jgi:phytoene dehydrogenase-like protein
MNETPAGTLDVAVIGSGFGGLTAAALAAGSGLRVAVFERHTRPGGCAGDFALGGYWFPAGATVVTGLEHGGILRQVFDALAISVESQPLDPSIVFRLDGRAIPYVASSDGWIDEFRRAFPDAPAGYARFWEWTHGIGGIVYRVGSALPSLPIQRWADVRRTSRAARPEVAKTLPLLFQTLGAIKARLGASGHAAADALIDSLLLDATGATAARCSAIQGALALDLYRRGCQWVEGGTARLARELVRNIRRNGGEVFFAAEVTALAPSSGCWRLTLAGGQEVLARRVVANIPPAALDRLRGGRPALPAAGDAWGAFVLHLGIDGAALAPMHPFHQVITSTHEMEAEGASCLVSVYPGRGDRSDRWSISVSTHTRAEGWFDYPARTACRRAGLESRLLRAAAEVIPGLDSRVKVMRSATPATFQRFTGRPGGFVGGLVQYPGNVAFRAPHHRPGRGLFLAGDHVFPGQGTVGTALSGINAYRDVVESLGVRPAL